MTTKVEISKSNQVLLKHKKGIDFLLILILAAVLATTIIATQWVPTLAKEVTIDENSRANQAWAARYQGLADLFAIDEPPQNPGSVAAFNLRYQALTKAYYKAQNAQRAAMASTARYQGLAELFAPEDPPQNPGSVANFTLRYQELTEAYYSSRNVQRAAMASAARYQAMADFFQASSQLSSPSLAASAARYQGLADFFLASE